MERSLKFILTVLFNVWISGATGQDTIAGWNFDQSQESLAETVSGKKVVINTLRQDIELVKGFKGKGLRTDGNSTWIEEELPSLPSSFTLSGWFALETYPTDTAGFFSVTDSVHSFSVTAGITRFGRPVIGIRSKEQWTYYGGQEVLPRFRWMHIALSVEKDRVTLFINGKESTKIPLEGPGDYSFHQIFIGRDQRMKKIHIFPVTVINGIIDEVLITKSTFTSIQQDNVAKNVSSNTRADLSIPAERFRNDFNRPAYHLLPAANWTNETHGLIFYKNRYHIFNQKNGANVFLGQINWGHFSTPDLVNWIEHIPAVSPEPGYDELGIWSGHVVLDKGEPVMMYTGGHEKHLSMNLAFPQDTTLIRWKKFEGNPVVDGPPQGYSRKDLRDPYLWKEGANWYMAIGYGVEEDGVKKGALLLYRSTDLKDWKFVHLLFKGDPERDNSGIFWEMPVFFRLNGKYILLVNKVPVPNVPAVALYWTGEFKNEKFIPDHKIPHKLEVVNRLLSPSVCFDAKGRPTAIAIIPDETSGLAAYRQGWTHVYSIPRTWNLVKGKIIQQPHPHLKNLRTEKASIRNRTVQEGSNQLLSKGTHQVEIEMELIPGKSKRFGLIAGKGGNGELTKIYYDVASGQFVVDQTKSSQQEGIPLDVRTGAYKILPGEKLKLHVFIDGSVVEVFINNRDAFTTRIFPKDSASNTIEVFCEGGSLKLIKADVWKLKRASITNEFREQESLKF